MTATAHTYPEDALLDPDIPMGDEPAPLALHRPAPACQAASLPQAGSLASPADVLALLGRLVEAAGDSLALDLQLGGKRVRLTVGEGQPPPPPPDPEPRDDDRDCRADILTVLRAAGRRLTADQILADMQRLGMAWGDRTVKGHLGAMVTEGILDNPPSVRPRGYAIVRGRCPGRERRQGQADAGRPARQNAGMDTSTQPPADLITPA